VRRSNLAGHRDELITFPVFYQLKPSEPLAYPIAQQPAPGEALEIAPGVRWLRMPLPFELNHINLWLLEEADGWTIVDTGLNLDDIKRELGGRARRLDCRAKPVKRIVVTHCHPDHLGLARWLGEKTGAGTWITQGEILNAYAWFHQLPNYDVDGMVGFFRRHGLDEAPRRAAQSRPDLPRPRRRPARSNTAVSLETDFCASAATTGASSSATAIRPSTPACIAPSSAC
jgi:hypothetical protein